MGSGLMFVNRKAIWAEVTNCPMGEIRVPARTMSACTSCPYNLMHAGAPIIGCYQNFAGGSTYQILQFLRECASPEADPFESLRNRWREHECEQWPLETTELTRMLRAVVSLREARTEIGARYPAVQTGRFVDLLLRMCEGSLRLDEPIMFDQL